MSKLGTVLKKVRRLATSSYLWRRLLLEVPPFSLVSWAYLSIRHSDYIWLNIFNKKAHQLFLKYPPEVNEAQKKAIEDLKNSGIAVFNFTDLFDKRELQELVRLSEKYIEEKKEFIEKTPQNKRTKYYVKGLFGDNPSVVLDNKLMCFVFEERILTIVNSYLNMFSRMQNLSLQYNIPVPGDSILSQNWHRDPEDKEMVKMFFYLRDVDSSNGPFSYVPGSHYRGPHRKAFGRKPFQGIYTKAGAVEEKLGDIIKEYMGKAGTILLCDTSGLHKGGHCTKNPRIILHAGYVTDASISRKKYTLNNKPEFSELSPAKKYALYLD